MDFCEKSSIWYDCRSFFQSNQFIPKNWFSNPIVNHTWSVVLPGTVGVVTGWSFEIPETILFFRKGSIVVVYEEEDGGRIALENPLPISTQTSTLKMNEKDGFIIFEPLSQLNDYRFGLRPFGLRYSNDLILGIFDVEKQDGQPIINNWPSSNSFLLADIQFRSEGTIHGFELNIEMPFVDSFEIKAVTFTFCGSNNSNCGDYFQNQIMPFSFDETTMTTHGSWTISFNDLTSINGIFYYPLSQTIVVAGGTTFIIGSLLSNIKITESPLNGIPSKQYSISNIDNVFTIQKKPTDDQAFSFRVLTCADFRWGAMILTKTYANLGNFSITLDSSITNVPLYEMSISILKKKFIF
jgi:hypothetical protein